eukprot:jgi/Botrbrau1/13187/Bobra.242_1s0017.1
MSACSAQGGHLNGDESLCVDNCIEGVECFFDELGREEGAEVEGNSPRGCARAGRCLEELLPWAAQRLEPNQFILKDIYRKSVDTNGFYMSPDTLGRLVNSAWPVDASQARVLVRAVWDEEGRIWPMKRVRPPRHPAQPTGYQLGEFSKLITCLQLQETSTACLTSSDPSWPDRGIGYNKSFTLWKMHKGE